MNESERIDIAFELANNTRHLVRAVNYLGDYEDDFIKIEFVYKNSYEYGYTFEKYIDNINVYSKKDDTLVYQTEFDGTYCVNLYKHDSKMYAWEKHLMSIYKKKLSISEKGNKKSKKIINDLKKYQEKKLTLRHNNYCTK